MVFSRDALGETVEVARDYLRASSTRSMPVGRLARDFAAALVQLAGACVIGLPCEKHGGAVHGKEAEELRAGVEQILRNTADVRDDDAHHVLRELRKSLVFLLDRIDARDSLAFLEATDPSDAATEESAVSVPSQSCPDGPDVPTEPTEAAAYRARGAARRAFFAARSVGDRISWGLGRSGVIQEIETDHVTVLDDGWPAEPPNIVFTPPFVARLHIDYMLQLTLVEAAPRGKDGS